ncbi:MAG: ribosome-associated translation inhibitor RaiA [Planctomycetaceae bacterium]|nr:ribosome-associated translation inhibitor RaiA [Planctomycetaceae bacterium]
MQVEIACRHGSIGDGVQAYIREKAEKLLTYFERVTQIQVTFDFNGNRVRAEILVDAEHKHDFVAHYEGEDAQVCFDHALHKIENQIKKYKEQVQDHRRDRSLGQLAESAAQAIEEKAEQESAEEN